MRIAELSRRTGVTSASIKHYVREGLLPAGERVGYNQTAYGDAHESRLHLIRALLDTGGLSVAATRSVLAAIDDRALPVAHVLSASQRAVSRADATPSMDALARVRRLVRDRGWRVCDDNPGIVQCAEVLDRFADMGRDDLGDMLERSAPPVLDIARGDLAAVAADDGDRDRMAETVVVGTALGDALLAGLRRIAQEHVSRSAGPGADPRDPA
ncbi:MULTISPECIES: MerR family transcriptional regulator [unclassified Agrococcus]|uniref:MerR family transcriptional regulator n=1 Tax=unclassified Agrococcus TaxID=2615065 RepID=UPI0036075E25